MDEERISLAKYRLEKALSCIEESEMSFDNKAYGTSLNRSYYAIFHSVRAVMALDGEDRKKHSGVIAYFQQCYIKTGIFDKPLTKIITTAFELRQESDYEDFFVYSHDDVEKQLENAKLFYEEMKKYVEEQLSK